MHMRSKKLQLQKAMKSPSPRKQTGAPKPAIAPASRAAKVADVVGRHPVEALSAEHVPAKWRGHHRVLRSLQRRLMEGFGALRHAVAEPIEPHSLDEADSATDEFDHDLALTRLSAEQDALYEVNEALQRIASGRYGRCEVTGQAIPAARLRAVPWTRFTRQTEERLEKQGAVQRASLGKAATVRNKGQIWLGPEEEAEEVEEAPPVPANDEALSSFFSPPGRHAARRRSSKLPPKSAKPKGRNP